jgi:hypothetical protein
MLELCLHWLKPVHKRSVARLVTAPGNCPARRAPAISFAHVTPGTRLALVHAPNHRPLR